jgi:hypothetical protein
METKQGKTFEKWFENANLVLKMLMVLWNTIWELAI